MDIHKPKPIRNWREFLKEVGIIVLGVCIALAAEQGVEWWHWRGKVALAREQIAGEMALNIFGAISRVRSAQCVEQRLDALSLILDKAAKSGTLPPVGDIGVPVQRGWSSGVWDSVVASETATHFPSNQLQYLAITYKFVQRIDETAQQEIDEWKNLYGFVGPGRRLDPASEAMLRQALGRARGSNRSMTNQINQMLVRIGNVGLPFSREDRARLARARQQQLTGIKPTLYLPIGYGICDPIGSVPGTYGQGPISAMPSLMKEAVSAIPDFSGGTK